MGRDRYRLGSEETFSLRGGAWVGWSTVSWPLARLSGGETALRLSFFGRDYVFFHSSIRSLSKIRFVGLGLRIEHTVPTYPQDVVFWAALPWSPRRRFYELKAELQRLGYDVLG
jgi:hypothetical protein